MNNYVRYYRHLLGVNQNELAKAVGVTRQSITSIETGKYKPSLETALKIARFFGVSVSEVFLHE